MGPPWASASIDEETLRYFKRTGRTDEQVDLIERYCKAQGLFLNDADPDPEYSDTLELDLSTVVPSLAGPKRPQDRIPLTQMKSAFAEILQAPLEKRGFESGRQRIWHEPGRWSSTASPRRSDTERSPSLPSPVAPTPAILPSCWARRTVGQERRRAWPARAALG